MFRRKRSTVLQAALVFCCVAVEQAAAQDHAGQYTSGRNRAGLAPLRRQLRALSRREWRSRSERRPAKRQVPQGGLRRRPGTPDHHRSAGHRHAAAQIPGRRTDRHRGLRPRHADSPRRRGSGGRRATRQGHLRRQRRLHELPSRQRTRLPRGARPERHRHDPLRRGPAAIRCSTPPPTCCPSIARCAR